MLKNASLDDLEVVIIIYTILFNEHPPYHVIRRAVVLRRPLYQHFGELQRLVFVHIRSKLFVYEALDEGWSWTR